MTADEESADAGELSALPKRATVRVNNIPRTATADELVTFFESASGPVFAAKITSHHATWHSLGFGVVQFESLASAAAALCLSRRRLLNFQRSSLDLLESHADIVARAPVNEKRLGDTVAKFGILTGEREMEVLGEWRGVRVELVCERGGTMLLFLDHGGEKYKLEIYFGDIVNSFHCLLDSHGQSNAILLQLKYAPRLYRRLCGPSLKTKLNSVRYHFCKEDAQFLWVRTVDFSSASIIGRSSHLCLEIKEGLSSLEVMKNLPFLGYLGNLILKQGEQSSYSSSKLVPIIGCPNDCSVPYEVLFQLNSLVHMQKLSSRHLNFDLFSLLSGMPLDAALKILKKMHDLNSTCYKPVEFIQNQLSCLTKQKNLPSNMSGNKEHLMSCHRAIVTPSKVYLLGPELETYNYVVKHFSAYASDFLRVSFVDEDWCKLRPGALATRTEQDIFSKPYRTGIYNRILLVLQDGIFIGPKKFEFLAFSASQLRDSAVWMFASNDSVTAHSIREWMGQFKEIYSVSKCAARMGQLFSSSTQTLNVPSHEVTIIPDVEVTTDGIKYCFSDGIGKISRSFARQVAQKCGLNHTPSAFQIRYGGYKGVIAVDPSSYRKLSLRPSMLKFTSNNTMLNVTKCSESQPCYLNREIICLLSTLGVEDEIFELLQCDQIGLLDDMLIIREAALTVLGRIGKSEIKTAVKMLNNGYEPNVEPYLSFVLKAYREFQLSDIRSRFRIFVPKGRVLIGCLDELGTLDYGQVFLRVKLTKEEVQNANQASFVEFDDSTAVIVGKVVVTKNPCLHPGDVRVLQAIYEPQLDNKMGLVDCIVFPQKGQRPHPNECSGGDLDGDLYFVSWDERLIPAKPDIPMDYIARRPRIMDHKVTLEEIQKFFVDYMINDNLGAISDAHLVHADSEPGKARSQNCLELAKLHSMSVDYAKTGAPAEMPNALRPKRYPDFLERLGKPTYESKGVLGKLYRAAARHSESTLNSFPDICMVIPYDYDLEVDGFEDFLGTAQDYYCQYAERLSSLMKYYEVEHEDEMLTGHIRTPATYLRDRRRLGEVKDRMSIAVKSLHTEVAGWFSGCCGSEPWKMAAAWYHVTYHPNYNCGSGTRFLSFPWVICDVLLSIKRASKAS